MQALTNPLIMIHGLAMLALVSVTYGFMSRTMRSHPSQGLAVGFTFGLGAISTMADPIVMQEGVFLDARGVILTLAGPFGGVVAAVISAASAIAYRVWLGGAGAPIGCVTIIVATLVGVVFARWVPLRQGAYSLSQLTILAAFGSLHGFMVLPVLLFVSVPGLVGSLIPLCVLNSVGIVVLGSFLSAEGRRGHATRLLEKEAATDALTGLANRRTFDAAGTAMVREARASDQAIALLMIDLDHFKRVNDRWGHDVGDRVLRGAAGVVASEVGREGLVARFGGEEFAVLLPNTTVDAAMRLSERVRLAMETNVFRIHPNVIAVTFSIGVAAQAGDEIDLSKLFSAADQALYEAKAAGRNRCVGSTPDRFRGTLHSRNQIDTVEYEQEYSLLTADT